jgi:hypothetical protein
MEGVRFFYDPYAKAYGQSVFMYKDTLTHKYLHCAFHG